MNIFLQENSQDIFEEMKKSIEKAVAEIIKLVLIGPFSRFSYKGIFLPEN